MGDRESDSEVVQDAHSLCCEDPQSVSRQLGRDVGSTDNNITCFSHVIFSHE